MVYAINKLVASSKPLKGRTQAKSKLVSWLDPILIEMPVVDEQALREVISQLCGPRCTVVFFRFANCIGQLPTGRGVTKQDIYEAVSAFLARQTSPDDADDVGLCEDRLEGDRTDAVDDDNRGRICSSDSLD